MALKFLSAPWVDRTNYYATRDAGSLDLPTRNVRALGGALLDLSCGADLYGPREYVRVALINFNLFDNAGTCEQYVKGRPAIEGRRRLAH